MAHISLNVLASRGGAKKVTNLLQNLNLWRGKEIGGIPAGELSLTQLAWRALNQRWIPQLFYASKIVVFFF